MIAEAAKRHEAHVRDRRHVADGVLLRMEVVLVVCFFNYLLIISSAGFLAAVGQFSVGIFPKDWTRC